MLYKIYSRKEWFSLRNLYEMLGQIEWWEHINLPKTKSKHEAKKLENTGLYRLPLARACSMPWSCTTENYTQALEQTYSLDDTQLQSAYSQDMNWKLNMSSVVILCGMR